MPYTEMENITLTILPSYLNGLDWHGVGFAWDGASRILYVDDVEVAREVQAALESCEDGLYIGTGSAIQPGTFFSGLIDDVRIYNRAVSP